VHGLAIPSFDSQVKLYFEADSDAKFQSALLLDRDRALHDKVGVLSSPSHSLPAAIACVLLCSRVRMADCLLA
jgi:hypothetical protein